MTRVGWTGVLLCVSACAPLSAGRYVLSPPPPTLAALVVDPSARPTIASGRAGWPIMPVDPSVYVDAEGYHLFYTTMFCHTASGFEYTWNPADHAACDIDNHIVSIAYAFSADLGRTWRFRESPVVMPGSSGFDATQVETADVFRMGDTLYLAYSGDGEHEGRRLAARYQIGLARLTLGPQSVREAMLDAAREFERRATPLLPFDLRAGRFDNNVQEPTVVVVPDGIELYYVGLGLRLPDEPIDAPDQSIVSVGLGRATFDRQMNLLSRSESALLGGVNMPDVRYLDGYYHMFATTLVAGEAHRDGAISYATSADGVSWTEPQVVLEPGAVPGFDDWGLMAPTPAIDDDRMIVFYTAFGTTPGACVPAGPDGRFGLPVAGGSRCMFPTIGRAVSAPRR